MVRHVDAVHGAGAVVARDVQLVRHGCAANGGGQLAEARAAAHHGVRRRQQHDLGVRRDEAAAHLVQRQLLVGGAGVNGGAVHGQRHAGERDGVEGATARHQPLPRACGVVVISGHHRQQGARRAMVEEQGARGEGGAVECQRGGGVSGIARRVEVCGTGLWRAHPEMHAHH